MNRLVLRLTEAPRYKTARNHAGRLALRFETGSPQLSRQAIGPLPLLISPLPLLV